MARPALLVTGALLVGCGEGGVHVVVAAEPNAFSSRHPFDWIEIGADSGTASARACLFPQLEDPRALVPGDGSCADQQHNSRDASFTLEAWALAADPPRAVNFDGEADTLEVWATAGFGSLAGPVAPRTATRSEASYAEVTLTLGGGADFLETASCDLALSLQPDVEPLDCGAPEVCPMEPTSHSAALFCVDGQDDVRILNTGQDCPDNAIWRGRVGAIMARSTARVTITGHFARCVDGPPSSDCELTTDCVPPRTSVALLAAGNGTLHDVGGRSIECLPPRAGPVSVAFITDPIMQGSPNTFIEIRQEPTNAADACFFQLRAVDWVDQGS